MLDESIDNWMVPGTTLRHTLHGHQGVIRWIAWAPDGRTLASGSEDQTIRLWNPETGQLRQTLAGHK